MRNRMKDFRQSLAILVVAATICCVPSSGDAQERKGTFTGSWTASGQWQPLDFQEGREVFTFRLAGHVNLKNDIGEVADFWSECAGLWDSETGGTSRCVWRDPDKKGAAYLVLGGQLIKEDVEVTGEFVGGVGDLKGLTGKISFTWSSVYREKADRVLTGHTKNLSGVYHIPNVGN